MTGSNGLLEKSQGGASRCDEGKKTIAKLIGPLYLVGGFNIWISLDNIWIMILVGGFSPPL